MKRVDKEQTQAVSRHYATKHRDEWAALGVIPVTLKVPERDKDLVMRYAETLRAEHFVALVESSATDNSTFKAIAARNRPRRLNVQSANHYNAQCAGTFVGKQAAKAFKEFEAARRQYDNYLALSYDEEDADLRTIYEAKVVAYSYAMMAALSDLKALSDEVLLSTVAQERAEEAVEQAKEKAAMSGEDLAKLRAISGYDEDQFE